MDGYMNGWMDGQMDRMGRMMDEGRLGMCQLFKELDRPSAQEACPAEKVKDKPIDCGFVQRNLESFKLFFHERRVIPALGRWVAYTLRSFPEKEILQYSLFIFVTPL